MFMEDSKLDDFDSSFEDFSDDRKELRGATFVGTPAYASPEMLAMSVSGPFTDLWSLGVIIYEMLEGNHPWSKGAEFNVF